MDSKYLLTQSEDTHSTHSTAYNTKMSVQEMNNMILSKIPLPSYLIDNQRLIRTEQHKIANLRATIDRCDAISQATIFTIDNFSAQIRSLEQLLTPMHNETHNIITAQKNIDASLRDVHHIMDNLDVIQRKSDLDGLGPQNQTITERLHSDYREFIHYLFQLLEAQRYWSVHSHYKGSDRIVKKLNETIQGSVNECAVEFEKILAMSSKPIDIFRLGWPLPSNFEWLADTVVERLSYIAQGLVHAEASGYVADVGNPNAATNAATVAASAVIAGVTVVGNATTELLLAKNNNNNQGGTSSTQMAELLSLIKHKPLLYLVQTRAPFLKQTYKLLITNHNSAMEKSKQRSLATNGSQSSATNNGQIATLMNNSFDANGSLIGPPGGGFGGGNDPASRHGNLQSTFLQQSFLMNPNQSIQSAIGRPTMNHSNLNNNNNNHQNEILPPGAAPPGQSGSNNNNNNLNNNGSNSLLSPQNATHGILEEGEHSDRIGRYQKGTHYIVFLTNVLLGILEREWTTWLSVLSYCEDLEQEDIDCCFGTAITPVLHTFAKRVNEALYVTSNNKLLFTLDILGHLDKLQPRFRAVLKPSIDQQDCYSIYSSIKATITDQIQNILLEHIINRVHKTTKFDKKTRKDGSVSDVTVETMTFLRALCTYDEVLDRLPVQVAYTATTKPFVTDSSHLTTKDGEKVKIPSIDEVTQMNQRLLVPAKAKFEAKQREKLEQQQANGNSGGGNNGKNTNDDGDGNNNNNSGGITGGIALEERFVWKTVLPLSILPGLAGTKGFCTVSQGVVWDILQGLDATLQVRAEALKRPDLQWLYFLNNYHHITQSASKHHFRVHPLFLGFYVNKTERAKQMYQVHTFKKLLDYLDLENYDRSVELPDKKTGGIKDSYKKVIKSKFAGFNKAFTELYKAQKQYYVPDSDLRGQLRSESTDILIPSYEKFLKKFLPLPFSSDRGKYFVYRSDFIEASLNKFFDELT